MQDYTLYSSWKNSQPPFQPDNYMIPPMNKAWDHCGALLYPAEYKTKHVYYMGGKIVLPPPTEPPPEMISLSTLDNIAGRKFHIHIRAYNSVFLFTSL